MIFSAIISSTLSGFIVSAFDIWVPPIARGAAIGTVGCGLLYTFNINTTSSQWINYQRLTGMSVGITIQIPLMANQAHSQSGQHFKHLGHDALLPNSWGRILHPRSPIRVRQQADQQAGSRGPGSRPASGAQNLHDGSSKGFPGHEVPGHFGHVHGQAEGGVYVGGGPGWHQFSIWFNVKMGEAPAGGVQQQSD